MDVFSLFAGTCEGKPNNKPKLFFIPCAAGNQTNSCHEIPAMTLFRSLLNENADSANGKETFWACKLVQMPRGIDHECKISQVETHRQKKISVSNFPFSIFLVFQTVGETGDFWWSLETFLNHVVIQRSRDKDEVKNKFKGETREGTELIAGELEGKGCMRELLTLLWIHMIVDVKYQRYLSRCESLVPLVIQKITNMRYEYEKDFTYSALSAEEKSADLSEIIDFLSNVSNWHPLVVATYLGDTELLDRLKKDGKYNINGIYNNFTLLNLAILFSKTEMVQHLQGKLKADPLKSDKKGRNALHMAAKFNREKKIINLLINKIFIDHCDATGTTALNYAIMTSNTTVVQRLLDNGADPGKKDPIGRLPLHVAAFYATETNIIDLLLQKKKIVDVDDCDKFGVTALHNAAMASNSKTTRHLLEKGADINCRDKCGLTPLHVAVAFAREMEMIDLFLNNEKINLHCCDKLGQNIIAYAQKNTHGLREKIIDRLKEIDDGVIKEYHLLKLAKSEMQPIPIWKSLAKNLHCYFTNDTFQSLSAQTPHPLELFYVPCADLKPGKGSEISEPALIWYIANKGSRKQRNFAESEMPGSMKLLSDIDHDSKMREIQIYRNKSNSAAYLTRAFFLVFKTTSEKDGEHWWSLDRNVNHVVLQRSRDTDAVKNKFGGKERKDVEPHVKILIENGSNKITSHQKPVLDLNNFLTGMYKWHPLFLAIYFGNARLFERIKEMAKLNNKLTLLNSERTFSNRKEIVLPEKQNADPKTCDGSGLFQTAAIHADNAEVLDLLLKHENVKIDGFGRSALHYAAISSNVHVARHLINMGEKPNLLDSYGLSPLHLAAYHSDDTKMIKFLLKAQKIRQGDEEIDHFDNNGTNALHSAAIASNEITAKYLIERGADPNRKDKLGRTPLHLAALFAKNIKIIDVFLNNKQVDVNSLDYSGQNALNYAKRNQYGQTQKILTRVKEISTNTMSRGNNTTALNLAIQYSKEMVKLLHYLPKLYSDGIQRVKLHNPFHGAPQSKDLTLISATKDTFFLDLLIHLTALLLIILLISVLPYFLIF